MEGYIGVCLLLLTLLLQLFEAANSGRLFYMYFFSPEGFCSQWHVRVSVFMNVNVCMCACVHTYICI